jgi:hypothetical protein
MKMNTHCLPRKNIYNWSVFQIYVELEATEQYKVQPEVLAVTFNN